MPDTRPVTLDAWEDATKKPPEDHDKCVKHMTFAEMFLLNQNARIRHPYFLMGTREADAFTSRFQSLAVNVTPNDLRELADRMEEPDA